MTDNTQTGSDNDVTRKHSLTEVEADKIKGTQELDELYDNWFYSLADEEPDGTYTLTVHEVHDGEAYSKLEELITDWHNKQIEAVLDRLESQSRRADECTDDTLVVKMIRVGAERERLKESK